MANGRKFMPQAGAIKRARPKNKGNPKHPHEAMARCRNIWAANGPQKREVWARGPRLLPVELAHMRGEEPQGRALREAARKTLRDKRCLCGRIRGSQGSCVASWVRRWVCSMALL